MNKTLYGQITGITPNAAGGMDITLAFTLDLNATYTAQYSIDRAASWHDLPGKITGIALWPAFANTSAVMWRLVQV